jgi:hypothetical protein
MLENLDTVIAFSVVMLLLSLMITALVQIVVSLFALRGKNLFWGVKRLLWQVDPQLGAHAEEIADRLLRHPAITHTSMSRAVAIRPEELIRLLRELANPPADTPPTLKKLSDAARTALKTRLDAMATAPNAPQTNLQLDAMAAELRRLFPHQAAAIDTTVRQTMAQGDALVQRVNTWFDSLMDRTSERFKLYTRYITVGVTVLFVLVLHVDSISIFRQVSTNPEIRAQLVQASDATLRRAEEVFAQTGRGKGQPLASDALQKMSEATDALGQKIKAECVKTTAAGTPGCSGGLWTREDGRRWIADHLPNDTAALSAYEKTMDDVTIDNIKSLNVTMTTLRGDLDQTQVKIFPKSLALAKPLAFAPGKEILGLITSILLLSLGAPFWYNVLRKLSDLRPIVARKVEGEAPKAQQ